MTHANKLSRVIAIIIWIIIVSCNATKAAEVESGKAIYTASRSPISAYFKEQKNKLRPYFTRPAASSSSDHDISHLYPDGLSVHDDTSATDSLSHSGYYDGGINSSPYHDNNNVYHSTTTGDDDQHHGGASSSLANPYGSSTSSSPASPEAVASNAIYSVANPNGYGGGGSSGGYYGESAHASPYTPQQASFHGGDYYGGAGGGYPAKGGNYQENSLYNSPSSPPVVGAMPKPHSSSPSAYYGGTGGGSPTSTTSHHAPPTSNLDKHNDAHDDVHSLNGASSDNSAFLFPIPGGAGSDSGYEMIIDDDIDHSQGSVPSEFPSYDYGSSNPDEGDDDMDLGWHTSSTDAAAGGSASSAPATSTSASQPPPENPLNFLNLVGTDFQPGRLVNIFFGLFIMLFMIITHGYALWILGIAYLPGTRSLNGNQWEMDWEKVDTACHLVLDALEYWENKVDSH